MKKQQRGKRKTAKEGGTAVTEEEDNLGQVVDDKGEEENHDGVEEQFGQTKQQAPCFQSRLQKWQNDKVISLYEPEREPQAAS